MTGSTAVDADLMAPPRWGGRAVLVLSVWLAIVEVGRFATFSDAKETAIAALAAMAYVPVHLWHLSYGLRGERPPKSGLTLCWMGVVHASALLALGPSWSFSLAALATSALIVLRPRWSLAVLLACLCGPLVAYVIDRDLSGALGGHVGYLVMSVAFRTLLQFSLVWLVATTYQLAAARGALAEEAAAHERSRVNHRVREALERNLAALSRAADDAQRQLRTNDTAAAQESLRETGALSRATLASARRIVSTERLRDASPVSAPRVPDTPIMAGIPRDLVAVPFLFVHLAVLGFLLLQFVGLTSSSELPESRAISFLGWLVLSAVQIGVATAVARGVVLRHGLAIWLVVVGVCVALRPLGGETTNLGWWIAATTAIGLWGPGRRTAGAVAVALAVLFAVESRQLIVHADTRSTGELVERLFWYVPYMGAVTALVVAGLTGVALLVRRVDELGQLLSVSARAAADAERLRASRDVHDLLSQNFSAIALKSDLAGRQLTNGDVLRAEHQVAEVAALANEQQERLQRASEGFADTTVQHELATAAAILGLAGVEVSTSVSSALRLEPHTDTVLGRLVREATTNVLRHARARKVETRLVEQPAGIVLEVRNDGASRAGDWGTGLTGLAESVAGIGGTFEAESGPDRTFAVTVTVPRSGR